AAFSGSRWIPNTATVGDPVKISRKRASLMVAMARTLPSIWYRERVRAYACMVSFLALATCASRTPAERERAVSKLPAHARLIAAADGPALAPFRPVIDAARPLVPRT